MISLEQHIDLTNARLAKLAAEMNLEKEYIQLAAAKQSGDEELIKQATDKVAELKKDLEDAEEKEGKLENAITSLKNTERAEAILQDLKTNLDIAIEAKKTSRREFIKNKERLRKQCCGSKK